MAHAEDFNIIWNPLYLPGSLKFRASKYTYKTSFSCKVDSKSNDEENEEGGETSELQHSFPFLCFLVLQQRKAKEKTREESKNMSNHKLKIFATKSLSVQEIEENIPEVSKSI